MIEYHKLSPPRDVILFNRNSLCPYVKYAIFNQTHTSVGIDKIIYIRDVAKETLFTFRPENYHPLTFWAIWLNDKLGLCVDRVPNTEICYARNGDDMFNTWHVKHERNCVPMFTVQTILTTSDVLITDPYSMYEFLAQ
jgi:hypothetical protein